MQVESESSFPENRVPVSSYLASSSVAKVERVLAGLNKGQSELRWEDISDSNLIIDVYARCQGEEERMENKLRELRWNIDESNTLLLITGEGRLEMVGLPSIDTACIML